MSRRVNQAIDFVALATLVVAGLMIAAGMARAAESLSASARKVDRAAVASIVSAGGGTTAQTDAARQTTTLIRTPLMAAAF